MCVLPFLRPQDAAAGEEIIACAAAGKRDFAQLPSPFERCRAMPSSVIRRFAWRPHPPALDVEFVTGRVYRYAGVPEDVALAMHQAPSRGSFFSRRIRDRYPCERLRGGWPPDEPELEPA